jgi:hypothetical protein
MTRICQILKISCFSNSQIWLNYFLDEWATWGGKKKKTSEFFVFLSVNSTNKKCNVFFWGGWGGGRKNSPKLSKPQN